MTSVLGLPLDRALAACPAEAPLIVETRSPRETSQAGTLRVVRVDEAGRWVVARFPDRLAFGKGEAPCD